MSEAMIYEQLKQINEKLDIFLEILMEEDKEEELEITKEGEKAINIE